MQFSAGKRHLGILRTLGFLVKFISIFYIPLTYNTWFTTCLKVFGPHWYPIFRLQTSLWLKFWECWKDKHRLPMKSISSTPRYVYQRIANRCPNNKPDTVVHSSVIHNSQKLETTRMFISLWMDKQNVAYPHSWVLLSHKREWMKYWYLLQHR